MTSVTGACWVQGEQGKGSDMQLLVGPQGAAQERVQTTETWQLHLLLCSLCGACLSFTRQPKAFRTRRPCSAVYLSFCTCPGAFGPGVSVGRYSTVPLHGQDPQKGARGGGARAPRAALRVLPGSKPSSGEWHQLAFRRSPLGSWPPCRPLPALQVPRRRS